MEDVVVLAVHDYYQPFIGHSQVTVGGEFASKSSPSLRQRSA